MKISFFGCGTRSQSELAAKRENSLLSLDNPPSSGCSPNKRCAFSGGFIIALLFSFSALVSNLAWGGQTYSLPAADEDIIGYVETIRSKPGDTFVKLARQYGVGYDELLNANPQVSPRRLRPWTELIIPSSYILPPGPREGIVINVSELRLYYYPAGENSVFTAPVSLGRQGWETPLTKTSVIDKTKNPDWHVPESIKQYTAKHGYQLPDVVPAGPQNPLGQYMLRLGLHSYLIHGTNDPYSIGKRISSGCVRMYPEDVEALFYAVPVGTPVRIINEPYKAGKLNGQLFLEAHKPIDNGRNSNYRSNRNFQQVILQKHPPQNLNWHFVQGLVQQHRGYPQAIQ